MKEEVVIRDYKSKDKNSLKKCIIELQDFERVLEPDRLEGATIVERNFRDLMDTQRENKGKIFVAEIEHEVVGFIRVELEHDEDFYISSFMDYAHILDLVILQRYRGRGLGTQLLRKAEEFAKQNGMRVLIIEVLAKNQVAADVYLHAGFRPYELTLIKESSDS